MGELGLAVVDEEAPMVGEVARLPKRLPMAVLPRSKDVMDIVGDADRLLSPLLLSILLLLFSPFPLPFCDTGESRTLPAGRL